MTGLLGTASGIALAAGGLVAVPAGGLDALAGTVYVESTNVSTTQTNMPFEFMVPIPPNQVQSGYKLVVKDGATTLDVQEDNHRTIGSDYRLIKVTGILPSIGASTRKTLTITREAGSPATGTGIAVSDITATDFEVVATCTIGGTDYTAAATDGLNAGTTWSLTGAVNHGKWRDGPFCTEYIVSVPLTASGPTYHSHLRAWFHISAYKASSGAVSGGNPITGIKCQVIIENGYFDVLSPGDVTYTLDISLTDGTTNTVVSSTSFEHWYGQRIKWSGANGIWWGTEAEFYQAHDWDYLRTTKALPNFDYEQADLTLPLDVSDLNSSTTPNTLLNTNYYRNVFRSQGTAGNRDDIGIVHEDQLKSLIAESYEGYRWITEQGEVSGWYPGNFRDDSNGKLIDPADFGSTSTTWRCFTSTSNGDHIEYPVSSNENWSLDIAHGPSVSFIPYLLTGDLFYLEQLAFEAQWYNASRDPAYSVWYTANGGAASGYGRIYWSEENGQANGQVRGAAWYTRTMAQTAFCIPDTLDGTVLGMSQTVPETFLDEAHKYWTTLTIDLTSANTTFGSGDRFTTDSMHFFGPSGNKSFDYGSNTCWFPWQNNYVNLAFHHANELGVLSTAGLNVQSWLLDGFDNLLSLSGWGVAKDRMCTAYRVPFYDSDAGRQNIQSSATSLGLDINSKFESMWNWACASTFSQGAPGGSTGPSQFLDDQAITTSATDGSAITLTFGGAGLAGTLSHYVGKYIWASTDMPGNSTTPMAKITGTTSETEITVDTTFTHEGPYTAYDGDPFASTSMAAGDLKFPRPEYSDTTYGSAGSDLNGEADRQYIRLTQMAGVLCSEYGKTNGTSSKTYGDSLATNYTGTVGYEKFRIAVR